LVWLCIAQFIGCFANSYLVAATEMKHSLTVKISRNYLQSFPISHATNDKEQNSDYAKWGNIKMALTKKPIKLAATTQRKVCLRTIFREIDPENKLFGRTLLNHHAWNDLDLFCGGSSNPAHHLLSRINRTTTVAGECALAMLLVRPTHDISTLVNRQKVTKFLLENPDKLREFKQVYQDYLSIEERLLSFWTSTDPFYTNEYKTYMRDRFLSDTPSDRQENKTKWRMFLRNSRDIYGEFIMLPLFGLAWSSISFCTFNIFNLSDGTLNFNEAFSAVKFFVPGYSIFHVIKNTIGLTQQNRSFLPFLGVAITNGLAIWRGYCGVKCYKEYSTVFKNLASRMKDVQVFMHTIQKIDNMVAKDPILEEIYAPSLKSIRALLNARQEANEVGTMVRNLFNINFDNWHYLVGKNSKLLSTYVLFEAHKDYLKSAIYDLGELDAFMGIATLLQELKKNSPEHCYTFAEFLSRSQQATPLIQFQAMWNPLLNPLTVIDNEVQLASNGVRNMILCGPNAGGKSSFLSGVAINLLLAQTFGVVAARHAILTPFDTITTYIEIGDDIASGESLFMVEVDRIQHHLRTLEKSKTGEFIFSIFDEPFAGTNPLEAEAAAYSTLAYMAKYPNAIHMIASHYPILMQLENDFPHRGLKNFKVFIREEKDQSFTYMYKIVPGKSTQRLGLKILEKEGYAPELIQKAKEVVKSGKKTSK